jgi:RsiW-degrading membrane proteinase PrsW (M82 family)
MVDLLQITSAVAGFGPAIFLLYFTVSNYTYPKVKEPFFDDSKIFKFFALGIALGMIIFAFEEWSRPSNETIIALVVLYALMEELMKLVILNFPRFQRKLDTAFYGLALGLGISTTYTFATVYVSLLGLDKPGAFEMIAYSLLGLQFVFLHGSTTTMIGIGVVRRDLKAYFSEALLVHLGYNLLMIPFFMESEPWNYMGLGAASALVVYAYYRIHSQSLPALIKDAKRMYLRKDEDSKSKA